MNFVREHRQPTGDLAAADRQLVNGIANALRRDVCR